MAKYKIKPGTAGMWLDPFDSNRPKAGGSVVTTPDAFEPNIHWEPLDEPAKKAHAEQLAKKDANLKARDPALLAKLHAGDVKAAAPHEADVSPLTLLDEAKSPKPEAE